MMNQHLVERRNAFVENGIFVLCIQHKNIRTGSQEHLTFVRKYFPSNAAKALRLYTKIRGNIF
jgi:hypothetical protein